jgi:7-cyano-7-deazaguanine synthase
MKEGWEVKCLVMIKTNENAYILLSGGQDSFVCLIWAMQNFQKIEAISIAYEQRHSRELFYAGEIAKHFGILHTVYNIGNFISSIAESTLLNEGDHNTSHSLASNLPASFVPNRNGIFLTVISNHAFRKGEKRINLITGACETDFSGYPDCRDNYIKAKAIELSLGLDRPVTIYTPLMWKSKAETFQMAADAGKLNELIELTLTCYNGNETLNTWGRGCGECPACVLRKKGYEEFLER